MSKTRPTGVLLGVATVFARSSAGPASSSPAQAIVAQWLESFEEFPIRQQPASFDLDEVMLKMTPKQ